MATDSPPPSVPDPYADTFDFESLRRIKWGAVKVSEVYPDHMILASRTARRHMTFILYKQAGEFHLHGQNLAHGPLFRDSCAARNLVITGPLQRVLKCLTLAPTRPRAKRRRAAPALPLFPANL